MDTSQRNLTMQAAIANYRHPLLFYGLAVGGPMLVWSLAAYLSYLDTSNKLIVTLQSICMGIGLVIPIITALTMILTNPSLRKDFLGRIFNYRKTKLFYILVACFLMLASILVAQLISLLFGYSITQFALLKKATFSAGFLSAWVLLITAPFVEEFAWHTYGTDCLRNKFNLFVTCIIFTILWILFHSPLFFMKGYYHSNLWQSGWLYTANYFVSFFPFVIIVNWLYYKTERMILIAVLLHLSADIAAELFATSPMSKVIQTAIMLVLAVIIILKNRSFFFTKNVTS